jgi:hypothetical protein
MTVSVETASRPVLRTTHKRSHTLSALSSETSVLQHAMEIHHARAHADQTTPVELKTRHESTQLLSPLSPRAPQSQQEPAVDQLVLSILGLEEELMQPLPVTVTTVVGLLQRRPVTAVMIRKTTRRWHWTWAVAMAWPLSLRVFSLDSLWSCKTGSGRLSSSCCGCLLDTSDVVVFLSCFSDGFVLYFSEFAGVNLW